MGRNNGFSVLGKIWHLQRRAAQIVIPLRRWPSVGRRSAGWRRCAGDGSVEACEVAAALPSTAISAGVTPRHTACSPSAPAPLSPPSRPAASRGRGHRSQRARRERGGGDQRCGRARPACPACTACAAIPACLASPPSPPSAGVAVSESGAVSECGEDGVAAIALRQCEQSGQRYRRLPYCSPPHRRQRPGPPSPHRLRRRPWASRSSSELAARLGIAR
jgi:hypothetical protein